MCSTVKELQYSDQDSIFPPTSAHRTQVSRSAGSTLTSRSSHRQGHELTRWRKTLNSRLCTTGLWTVHGYHVVRQGGWVGRWGNVSPSRVTPLSQGRRLAAKRVTGIFYYYLLFESLPLSTWNTNKRMLIFVQLQLCTTTDMIASLQTMFRSVTAGWGRDRWWKEERDVWCEHSLVPSANISTKWQTVGDDGGRLVYVYDRQ